MATKFLLNFFYYFRIRYYNIRKDLYVMHACNTRLNKNMIYTHMVTELLFSSINESNILCKYHVLVSVKSMVLIFLKGSSCCWYILTKKYFIITLSQFIIYSRHTPINCNDLPLYTMSHSKQTNSGICYTFYSLIKSLQYND